MVLASYHFRPLYPLNLPDPLVQSHIDDLLKSLIQSVLGLNDLLKPVIQSLINDLLKPLIQYLINDLLKPLIQSVINDLLKPLIQSLFSMTLHNDLP